MSRCLALYQLIFLLFFLKPLYAQKLTLNGGITLQAEITLGNQNQWLKIGVAGLGIINYGDVSIESGTSFQVYQFLKRHTKKIKGVAYSYEYFALAGIGKNTSLLGSAILNTHNAILFNPEGSNSFNGLGFGFTKDHLPNSLKTYGLRRGMFIMRFSNAQHSIDLCFLNDFKIGPFFHGAGTDYGLTGSFRVGYTQIINPTDLYRLGVAIDLFTPKPNYNASPRNPINSDDQRKNVWFTLPPFKELFYGNVYAFGTWQNEHFVYSAKMGMNSQKTGAYVQNTLHDGMGLNPRFPWDVTQKDKLYLELSGANMYTTISNEK